MERRPGELRFAIDTAAGHDLRRGGGLDEALEDAGLTDPLLAVNDQAAALAVQERLGEAVQLVEFSLATDDGADRRRVMSRAVRGCATHRRRSLRSFGLPPLRGRTPMRSLSRPIVRL